MSPGGNEGHRHLDGITSLPTLAEREGAPAVCLHCWHQWGLQSGTIGSDGSSSASGTLRCCHCGGFQKYDYRSGPQTPPPHGKFFAEILRDNVS